MVQARWQHKKFKFRKNIQLDLISALTIKDFVWKFLRSTLEQQAREGIRYWKKKKKHRIEIVEFLNSEHAHKY